VRSTNDLKPLISSLRMRIRLLAVVGGT
jgi:hypothetical protein